MVAARGDSTAGGGLPGGRDTSHGVAVRGAREDALEEVGAGTLLWEEASEHDGLIGRGERWTEEEGVLDIERGGGCGMEKEECTMDKAGAGGRWMEEHD